MLTRIYNYGLTDIITSIEYLLEKAARSEEVQVMAAQITQYTADKISAIYDWVKANVRYVPDELRGYGEVELFTSPVRMIRDYNAGLTPREDCDGFALLTTALCRAIRIRSNVVLLDTSGNGIDHAVSEAYSDKLYRWLMLDATGTTIPPGWVENSYERITIN